MVARVLVEHVRGTGLDLRLENLLPEVLSTDALASTPFRFILLVERFKLVAVSVMEPRHVIRAEQAPHSIGFDTFHEQVRSPHGIEQVASSLFFSTSVLLELEEILDIRMPWLHVDGECTRALIPTLIDISGSVVEHSKHWYDTIAESVGTRDVRAGSANIVNVEADPASRLGNECTVLERLVDAINRILLHTEEEAGRQLRAGRACVE